MFITERMFSEIKEKEIRDEYFKLKERIYNGEYGDKIKREIDCLYIKMEESIRDEYKTIAFREDTERGIKGHTFYHRAINYLCIEDKSKLISLIEKLKHVYLPQQVNQNKEVIFMIINGKEYKCFPTGRTQESIIEDIVKRYMK